jgi:uncharacterized alkaline shock family protein YloU
MAPEPDAEPDAETVASATLSCTGVHALSRGSDVVEIATYLPGRRILGVRVAPGHAEVHIVTEYGANVVDVADRVRAAILGAVQANLPNGALPPQVDVYVDDVHGPDDLEPPLPPATDQRATPAHYAPGEAT